MGKQEATPHFVLSGIICSAQHEASEGGADDLECDVQNRSRKGRQSCKERTDRNKRVQVGTRDRGKAVDKQHEDENVSDTTDQGAEEGGRRKRAGGALRGRFRPVGGDGDVAGYEDVE